MPDDLSWILNHLGEKRDADNNAVIPPIHQSAMFCFETVAEMRRQLGDELANPFYTRGNNPTVEVLRRKLAALEGAEDALVFSSGSGAIAAAVVDTVSQGDEVVCVAGAYGWTAKLLSKLLPRLGVAHRFVQGGQVADFAAAIGPHTRMIILESPSSLLFELQDVAGIALLARERGITTLCDNSYATPLIQRPIEMGVDLVAHSGTKYLNGHSDVVAGVLCGSAERIRSVFRGPFMTLGACISPHDAWLMIRGLRTLPIRLERTRASTRVILDFLGAHPAVAKLHAPPKPMCNGLFSMELKSDDIADIELFCDSLERFLMTCSWGGHESLVFPMCALSESENYVPGRDRPMGLIRVSIGLEEPDVLVADLEQALRKLV